MAELPILVLAFANKQEGRRYPRDLPEELRRLQDILEEAKRHGLFRLEWLPNATTDQIFNVFTRNRDRVTILHYAGHADSDRLLLESSAGGGAPRTPPVPTRATTTASRGGSARVLKWSSAGACPTPRAGPSSACRPSPSNPSGT